MGSFWSSVAIVAVVAIIANMVVSIVRGGKSNKRNKALEEDLARLESDLDDAMQRIIVLEKIVTDGKHSLSQEIDDLAG